ncbi:VOC family protein [Agromyces protaetiae]|uniref:VOC family protein n=1 Tax=Agromyces protaetiae TaxID=2509455 RepID=A0A4P6F835_9MICO|nr:VOC family protein [Agromyces protaetiae]QAY71982.1 VOC family protein [Agromyces protaetiae]
MANLVVHFEIPASDPERLVQFYGDLFGWTFTRWGEMEYWLIDTGDGAISMAGPGHGINGGIMRREGPAPEPGAGVNGANVVVGVGEGETTDGLYAKAIELGATGILPPEDMAGIGRGAYLADPDGNPFGLMSDVLSDGTRVTMEG